MIPLVGGEYRFWKRLVGFKQEYCETCGEIRICQKYFFFRFFHLYWIILIPGGWGHFLICPKCGKAPFYQSVSTAMIQAYILAILMAIIFLGSFLISMSAFDPWLVWGVRLFLVVFVLVAFADGGRLAEQADQVRLPPVRVSSCLVCKKPMTPKGSRSPNRCAGCGVTYE